MKDDPKPIMQVIKDLQAGKNCPENEEALYRFLVPVVSQVFREKKIPPQEGEELTQEVIFRVFKSMPAVEDEERLKAWARKAAGNRFVDYVRRRKAEKRGKEVAWLEKADDWEGIVQEVADGSRESQPEAAALDRESWQLFMEEMQQLSKRQHDCILFAVLHEMSQEEIAKHLKIEVNTVKSHLHAARQRLAERLAQHFDKARRRQKGN